MAGPYTLEVPGNDVWLPTWAWGGTALKVTNLDQHNPGKVTVNAASAREDVLVLAQDSVTIHREWGGIEIEVVNSGGPPMVVETW
jgi:hypothetical protein